MSEIVHSDRCAICDREVEQRAHKDGKAQPLPASNVHKDDGTPVCKPDSD
jgi:hypothetical protein